MNSRTSQSKLGGATPPSSPARRRWITVSWCGLFVLPVSRLAAGQAAQPAPSAAANPTTPAADIASEPNARSIVERADRVRFPADAFEVDITITGTSGGQAAEVRRYKVLSKGNDNTIVQTTEPASERGQALLMRGRDLWIYMPNVSQPVRLSLSQRLTGQVSNGDLARANFLGDYNAKLVRTDAAGAERHNVLELTAAERGVTYAKVMYWVNAANGYPVKAEFYSVSDRLLKTCRYENYRALGNAIRPTRLVMIDALKAGDESVMEYSEMKSRDLPDRMFTKEYLKRL